MSLVRASAMRLAALDQEGNPTGEWVALEPSALFIFTPIDEPADGLPVVMPRKIEMNMSCHVDLVRNSVLRGVFGLRLTPRGRRQVRYWARSHGHAPRRRNKHGRVGVRA